MNKKEMELKKRKNEMTKTEEGIIMSNRVNQHNETNGGRGRVNWLNVGGKKKLSDLRVEKGLYEDDMKELLDISRHRYKELEQGKKMPTVNELRLLSLFFDVNESEVNSGALMSEELKKKNEERYKLICMYREEECKNGGGSELKRLTEEDGYTSFYFFLDALRRNKVVDVERYNKWLSDFEFLGKK